MVVLRTCLTICLALLANSAFASNCSDNKSGEKQLLWGDLHVHTSHSLDAWAFGATASPREAFAFAKGQPLRLVNGEMKKIDRPLDFAAVTDHAETWDQMYLCSDPVYADEPFCNGLRELHRNKNARQIFNDYLLPVIAAPEPKLPAICDSDDWDCEQARLSEWRRAQFVANEANEPCEFTALIGYEWTGTPGGRHWHRNVIFGSEVVPNEAYDFIRYPEVQQLWQKLDDNCLEKDGCKVLTIPHNLNWVDGGSTFDVENESTREQAMRTRFERLAEIYQEKGASECLPAKESDLGADCDFNLVHENTAKDRLSGPSTLSPEEAWSNARSTYFRTLLGRGIAAYATGDQHINPLMLGAIGSTDTHFGTPGLVSEESYDRGVATLFASDEQQLAYLDFNPGGLVAIWAEENTREGVFSALHRREAYATSGPRIGLKFGVANADYCSSPTTKLDVAMGGTIQPSTAAPVFVVQAAKDETELKTVQIIKGEVINNTVHETVIDLAEFPKGKSSTCVTWEDPDFDRDKATYWYARVLEQPSPRWSKLLCERSALCDEFPKADQMLSERAWSSPIWLLP